MTDEIGDMIPEGKNFVDGKLFKRASSQAEKIKWGEEWLARPLMERYGYLLKMADSLNEAVQLITKERDTLNTACINMEKDLKSCKLDRARDREMIQKQLLNENSKHQKVVEENEKLYAEIKQWRSQSTGAVEK